MYEKLKQKNLLVHDPKPFNTLVSPAYGQPQYIQVQSREPFRARLLELSMPGLSVHKMCRGALEVSDDGHLFKLIREFEADASAVSLNFEEVSARYFRIEFSKAEWYLEQLNIAEIDLSPEFRIEDIEA